MGGDSWEIFDPAGTKLREEGNKTTDAKSPDAPDYMGMAEATARGSREVNMDQTYANRGNTTTPWGNQTWTPTVTTDPATGRQVTTWNQNVTLNPEQQRALDSQMRVQTGRSTAAEGLLDQATDGFSQPVNWDDLPEGGSRVNPDRLNSVGYERAQGSDREFGEAPESRDLQSSLNGNSSDYRRRAQDAVDQLNAPDLEARREAAEARLASQGITQGSDAYNTEMRAISDAESRSHLMAIDAGRAEANQMFGQDLSAGQFGNQAMKDEFGMDLAGSQYQTGVRGQDSAERLALTGANNQYGFQANEANNRAITGNVANEVTAGQYNSNLRNQRIAEIAQQRGMSLNELNALLTGQQVQMPGMPAAGTPAGRAQGADYTGAATQQYGAAVSQANAQQAQNGQLAGAGLTALAMFY
jgi:hypothetical protein